MCLRWRASDGSTGDAPSRPRDRGFYSPGPAPSGSGSTPAGFRRGHYSPGSCFVGVVGFFGGEFFFVCLYLREQINKGDYVRIGGSWYEVARANQKTVSLITGYSWTRKADYAQIRDHRTTEEATTATSHGNTETQESVKTETSGAQELAETFAQVQTDEEELTAEEADYADET